MPANNGADPVWMLAYSILNYAMIASGYAIAASVAGNGILQALETTLQTELTAAEIAVTASIGSAAVILPVAAVTEITGTCISSNWADWSDWSDRGSVRNRWLTKSGIGVLSSLGAAAVGAIISDTAPIPAVVAATAAGTLPAAILMALLLVPLFYYLARLHPASDAAERVRLNQGSSAGGSVVLIVASFPPEPPATTYGARW